MEMVACDHFRDTNEHSHCDSDCRVLSGHQRTIFGYVKFPLKGGDVIFKRVLFRRTDP